MFTWWPSAAMYAVAASWRDAAMLRTAIHSGSPVMLAVTSVQVPPPSRVTCTSPSLVPAQISPGSTGDSLMPKTVPAYSTPMLSPVSPPERPMRLWSFRVRSGLITSQLCPPFRVRCTCWLPT